MKKVVKPTVLIFPYNAPDVQSQAELFKQLGLEIVCAHSEDTGEDLHYLPYVTASDFLESFNKLVLDHGITHILSPHPVIWSFLAGIAGTNDNSFVLLDPSPYERDLLNYQPAWSWAQSQQMQLANNGVSKSAGDNVIDALSGLYLGYFAIPGQSDKVKLDSLLKVMAACPQGDIVEIGSLFGRSAFALAYLARMFNTGSVLCVDPWKLDHVQNQGKSAGLVNQASHRRDFDLVFQAFKTNREAFGLHHLDWVRNPSHEASSAYENKKAFSRAPAAGQIALLHIDGNHFLEAVRGDINDWTPFVMPGGWILIDDYHWSFGTGPQQAANEFMAANKQKIDHSYCTGDTLYIRLID